MSQYYYSVRLPHEIYRRIKRECARRKGVTITGQINDAVKTAVKQFHHFTPTPTTRGGEGTAPKQTIGVALKPENYYALKRYAHSRKTPMSQLLIWALELQNRAS